MEPTENKKKKKNTNVSRNKGMPPIFLLLSRRVSLLKCYNAVTFLQTREQRNKEIKKSKPRIKEIKGFLVNMFSKPAKNFKKQEIKKKKRKRISRNSKKAHKLDPHYRVA